jgi:hypothetical protein
MAEDRDALTLEQQKLHERLQQDLRFFCSKALKIRTKEGKQVSFRWNKAQEFIHEQLETQLLLKGRVRALILKARQEGASTYVAARFYHRSTRQKHKSVFILSHETETTAKLFGMVERYQEHCPPPLRPAVRIANRRQLIFSDIGSDYCVGTAGNEDIGRGGTVQYFHGSEVGFWEHTDAIQTGIMQSIPDLPNTEIILESTANGMGNMFYEKCMDAMAGRGQYILIFIPWFWMAEYSAKASSGFACTRDEAEIRDLYKLTDDQMYWRRLKIEDLKSEWKFKQEYPANPMEAFQTSGSTLIRSEAVMIARRSGIKDPTAPLVIGVDPGRNRDRTVVAFRRGRQFFQPIVYEGKESNMTEMRLSGIIANLIDKYHPAKVFMDVGAGYGTLDRLHELGYNKIVCGVHFGEEPMESEVYRNKRSEMWCNMRDWLHAGGCSMPDSDAIHADLLSMPDYKEASTGVIFLLPKDDIRKKYGRSPDIGDAMALTFAFPVFARDRSETASIRKATGGHKSSLLTLQRMRGQDRRKIRSAHLIAA